MSEPLPSLDTVAAQIVAPAAGDTPYWAMATLLTPAYAVTADHALPPHQELELRFPNWPTSGTLPATVIARDPQIDFAIIRLASDAPVELPGALLAAVTPPRGAAWECLCIIPTAPTGTYARGTVLGTTAIDGRQHLQLQVTEGPTDPQGVSGAPVLVDDQIVGIVARADTTTPQWFAIPLAAMAGSTRTDIVRLALSPAASTTARSDTTLDEAALFRRLSPSARRALNHADGIRAALNQDRVHMEYLSAGLWEKEDGPTQHLLRAAGIDDTTFPQVLAEAVETPLPPRTSYTPASLTAIPPHSRHVHDALIAARDIADAVGSTAIQSRHLLYGALSVGECGVIQALHHHGVRKEDIDLSTQVVRVLRSNIAGFQSDDPDGEDLLGISREVEALCSVVAAKDVDPPLSLGLFGDWGSGKSFFMHKMEQRIEQIKQAARRATGSTAYCPNIVQLHFNAWHYIDTNLWASLAAEIFEGLAQALARDTALLAGEEDPACTRARLLAAASSRDVLAEAERKKSVAQAELQESEQRLSRLEHAEKEIEQSLAPKAVLQATYRFVADQSEVQERIRQAGHELNLPDTKVALPEVKAQLLELHGVLGSIKALAIAIRNTKERRIWLLLTLGVVLALVAIPVLLLFKDSLIGLFGSVLSVLAGVSLALKPFLPGVRAALNIVAKAREENANLITEERERKRQELLQQREQIQQKVIQAQRQVEQASAELKQLAQQLDELRADRQMSDFIKQRHASTDYRQHFGVIARARNDFEQLSMLMAQVREQPGGADAEKLRLPRIDRIILYIDDLDRCPEPKVVEVLQAVHLLLAFPLFVVVVGVDSRWLLHSLRQHSKVFQGGLATDEGLSDEERRHWQATPHNYLEKIFQIPFALRPMELAGFSALIDDLTTIRPASGTAVEQRRTGQDGHGEAPSSDVRQEHAEIAVMPAATNGKEMPPRTGTASTAVSSAAIQHAAALPDRSSSSSPSTTTSAARAVSEPVIDINPGHLRIEEWERECMKQLFQLIPSPRAAKRFVNVYRLLRALVDDAAYDEFVGDAAYGQYQAVLLLLAMLIGYPVETTEIIRALMERSPSESWWTFVDSFKTRSEHVTRSNNGETPTDADQADAERWRQLFEDLDSVRPLIGADRLCADFLTWAPEVARYSFYSGRVLLDQPVAV